MAIILLGGALKRRESLSARLGGALSQMYILSAALKRFEDDGRPASDVPLLTWGARHCLYEIQTALDGVLANFPYPPLGWLMRFVVFPLGRRRHPPKDKLARRVADLLLAPSPTRERLTAGIYIGSADEPVGQLDEALKAVIQADAITTKLKRLGIKDVKQAIKQGAIGSAEKEILERAADLTQKVIAVDDFAPDELSPLRNSR